MNVNNNVYIVIPVYNENNVIENVLAEIKEAGFCKIIIVDDGSDTEINLGMMEDDITIIRHSINRGKGAAVKTGIEAAKLCEADVIVTIDGDGQHNPQDIKRMLVKIDKGVDVVLGTRLKNPKGMPLWKVAANHFGNFCTWLIYGLWVTDSQSGFRAYSKKAIYLIETKTDRYEYDSEVIREISRNGLRYEEVPIDVRYTEYSMNKRQKQTLKNGIKTLIKMMLFN